MVAKNKLWSERRRGWSFETKYGNHNRRFYRHFNNLFGKNAKIKNLGKEILSWH